MPAGADPGDQRGQLGQARRRGQVGEGGLALPRDRAGGVVLDEQDQVVVDAAGAQAAQEGRLEGHDLHRRVRAEHPRGIEGGDQPVCHRVADRGEVGRGFHLEFQPDRAGQFGGQPGSEGEDLRKAGHGIRIIVRGAAQAAQRLTGQQLPQFDEGEILGEPAVLRGALDQLGGAPLGESAAGRDIGRDTQLVLVACDEVAVRRRHDVDLEGVRPQADAEFVCRERVFGQIAARTAVGDDHGDKRFHRAAS